MLRFSQAENKENIFYKSFICSPGLQIPDYKNQNNNSKN